jgi:hypothetical protein
MRNGNTMKLRTLLFAILFLLSGVCVKSQTYDAKTVYAELGTWNFRIPNTYYDMLGITMYVTRQDIVSRPDKEQMEKMVSDVPTFRYELVLVSSTKINNELTKTWIYNTKVYINEREMTNEQFPHGFTMLIDTIPTVVYWYETNNNLLSFKISWASSRYFVNNP